MLTKIPVFDVGSRTVGLTLLPYSPNFSQIPALYPGTITLKAKTQ